MPLLIVLITSAFIQRPLQIRENIVVLNLHRICLLGVTSLEFLKVVVLGEEHQYDMFVADFNNDYLYKFELHESRTGLEVEGDLKDGIANNNEELENVVFGEGFGVITDIKEGPDGYLYLVSHINGNI